MISRSAAWIAPGDNLHVGLVLPVYASRMLMPLVPLHIWRDHVLKTFGAALVLASGLATAAPAFALQTVVTQVDKNADGSRACCEIAAVEVMAG